LPYLRDLNPAQRAAVENGISNGVGTPPLGHCWSNAFGPGGEISWSGTFHAISNRLLCEHAYSISLDSSFTVLDRADAEDRLNLVRNDLGLVRKDVRFPRKQTCLAIYSHTVNACCPLTDTLERSFPWCTKWESELKELFRAYVEAKQRDNVLDYDDLLLF
jgi:ATP-dependent DNA helicase UvrD/PcrA